MNSISSILLAKMGGIKNIRYKERTLWKVHRCTDSRLLKVSIGEMRRENIYDGREDVD